MKYLKLYEEHNYISKEESLNLKTAYTSESKFDKFKQKDKLKDAIKSYPEIFKPTKTENILMWAIYKDDLDIIKFIFDNDVNNYFDINYQEAKNGNTLLFWAFDDASFETISYLIDNGADWEILNNHNQDFIDFMDDYQRRFSVIDPVDYYDLLKQDIIDAYPEKYEKALKTILKRKKIKKFNL